MQTDQQTENIALGKRNIQTKRSGNCTCGASSENTSNRFNKVDQQDMTYTMEQKSVISRKEAIRAKLTRYFLGTPCNSEHKHICERYTNTSHCVECDKIDRKKYREANRESIKEQTKRYRAKKLEKKQDLRIVEPITAEKKEKSQVIQIQPERKLAKPIPAPDWSTIGWTHESIVRRAEEYKEAYKARKNSR